MKRKWLNLVLPSRIVAVLTYARAIRVSFLPPVVIEIKHRKPRWRREEKKKMLKRKPEDSNNFRHRRTDTNNDKRATAALRRWCVYKKEIQRRREERKRNAFAVNGPLTVASRGAEGERVVNDSKQKIWMQMTEQTLTLLSLFSSFLESERLSSFSSFQLLSPEWRTFKLTRSNLFYIIIEKKKKKTERALIRLICHPKKRSNDLSQWNGCDEQWKIVVQNQFK